MIHAEIDIINLSFIVREAINMENLVESGIRGGGRNLIHLLDLFSRSYIVGSKIWNWLIIIR